MSDKQTKPVDELVKPGRFGVTNKQMIPALKQAIAANDVKQLVQLKAQYLYAFSKSLRYLSKKENEYVAELVK